jgi:hypothetical protein
MVLLDASFPEELDLEKYFPADERWDHTEWKVLEEQVFSPGVLAKVPSPRCMEAAVPDRIAQELEKVIDSS